MSLESKFSKEYVCNNDCRLVEYYGRDRFPGFQYRESCIIISMDSSCSLRSTLFLTDEDFKKLNTGCDKLEPSCSGSVWHPTIAGIGCRTNNNGYVWESRCSTIFDPDICHGLRKEYRVLVERGMVYALSPRTVYTLEDILNPEPSYCLDTPWALVRSVPGVGTHVTLYLTNNMIEQLGGISVKLKPQPVDIEWRAIVNGYEGIPWRIGSSKGNIWKFTHPYIVYQRIRPYHSKILKVFMDIRETGPCDSMVCLREELYGLR